MSTGKTKYLYLTSGNERIQRIRSRDDCPEQIVGPREVAIDDMDNIYVSSDGHPAPEVH